MILVISPKTTYAAKRLVEECGIRCRVMDMTELVKVNFKIDISQFSVLYVRNPYFNPVRSPMPEGIGSRPGRLTSNGVNGSPEYLPQIVELAKQFKATGKKVVDANITEGKLGAGKWEDYQVLKNTGLPIPATVIASAPEAIPDLNRLPRRSSDALPTPRPFDNTQGDLENGRTGRNDGYSYPLILKWIYGFKARNVFLVEDENQLTKLLPQHPQSEWLVQEFIKAEYEYKVITVGYKALPVVLRFGINKNGFRTDFASATSLIRRHSEGVHPTEESQNSEEILHSSAFAKASADKSDALGVQSLPRAQRRDDTIEKVIHLAESASKTLGRELAKVDILQKGNQFYILEVNRFPGLDSFEELTKFNVIKEFISYLTK